MQVQADLSPASTLAEPQLPADIAISERGLDDFDAWDEDTQKQWKRFMKGSRSQEVCQYDTYNETAIKSNKKTDILSNSKWGSKYSRPDSCYRQTRAQWGVQ